jgi:hypothetical protein
MNNSLQLAHQWWAILGQNDRQRVWDSRHGYLAGDLVESMAKAGVPVVSDGRWSCVSVGPTGFTAPIAVQQLLEELSQTPEEDKVVKSVVAATTSAATGAASAAQSVTKNAAAKRAGPVPGSW